MMTGTERDDASHSQGQGPSRERAEAYRAWASRLHEKRQSFKRTLDDGDAEETTYWTSDLLFTESRRVEEEELLLRTDDDAKGQLLAILDLRDDALADDVSPAYRRLAKQHHPDRYVSADEATQAWHAARMATINEAYRALRKYE